jgi:hypothetical protein
MGRSWSSGGAKVGRCRHVSEDTPKKVLITVVTVDVNFVHMSQYHGDLVPHSNPVRTQCLPCLFRCFFVHEKFETKVVMKVITEGTSSTCGECR